MFQSGYIKVESESRIGAPMLFPGKALVFLVFFSLMNAGANAASPLPAQGDSNEQGGSAVLDEILVTAQKRVENLQNVPVSVQVVSGQLLSEQNQNSFVDLTQTMPAVHVSSGALSNTLSIRGIGSGQNPAFDQSVSMFSDDIYHGRSRMSGATFFDLDRIEILKGPQSTFFGNNAIAGALNILTRKPSDDFEADGRLLYGMFDQYAADGAVSIPLTSVLSARLAVTRNGTGQGWIDNEYTGQHVPIINNTAGRLTLVFKPNESLDATLKVEGSNDRIAGTLSDQPLQWNKCPPPAPIPAAALLFGAPCVYALQLGIPIGLDLNRISDFGGQGSRLASVEDVLTVNYRAWDHTFTSVTGYYNYHYTGAGNTAVEPVFLATELTVEKYHQFSQEFRVSSPTGQMFEYLAGAYFQTDQLPLDYSTCDPALDFFTPYQTYCIDEPLIQNERVYSAFGALTWNVTDQIKLKAGLRESIIHKDFNRTLGYANNTSGALYGGLVPIPPAPAPQPLPLLGAPGTENYTLSEHALMPSGGIDYQIAHDVMAYLSYTRGFKAGGWNGFGGLSDPQNPGFGPEHVNAYELGLKSKWFDQRLLVNVDVFRSNYQGLQVQATLSNPITHTYGSEVRNAASSRAQGIEIEMQWAVTRDLRLSANITYLDSFYQSYPNAPPTVLQTVQGQPSQDISGMPTEFAPKWSGSIVGDYTVSLPGGYKFTTELSPYFTARYYNSGGTEDPIFGIVDESVRLDGRFSFASPDGRWALDLIGKNLTDRLIVTSPGAIGSKEQPRNVAVQARFKW